MGRRAADEVGVDVSSFLVSVGLDVQGVEVPAEEPGIIKSRLVSIPEVRDLTASSEVVTVGVSISSGLEKMLPISLLVSLSRGAGERISGIVVSLAPAKGVLVSGTQDGENSVSAGVRDRGRNRRSGLIISDYVQV